MPTASFTRFNQFAEDLWNGVHDLVGTNHTLKVYLSNTAPNQATHAIKADIAEISAGNGYVAGGVDIENDGTRTANVVTVTAVDKTITASGGSIGPFRYAIVYNDTPTSPADPLIGYYDYGSAITLADGDNLVIDFGASLLTNTVN
jgi:hypothetical protein